MTAMIRAENLSLVYRDHEHVRAVDGVSLQICAPEFVGILGPSGSGKSSLLYLLSGLKTPTAGRVLFNGEDISVLPADRRAFLRHRFFGFVFQNPLLIPWLTGLENACVNGADRDRAAALFEELRIPHCLNKFPYEMSAGERQRVAVARAAAHDPLVLFADEPTASLDRPNAELVVACLRRSARGALVVVTHDETILSGARILRMFSGRLQ